MKWYLASAVVIATSIASSGCATGSIPRGAQSSCARASARLAETDVAPPQGTRREGTTRMLFIGTLENMEDPSK
jgi:hypothetical protein